MDWQQNKQIELKYRRSLQRVNKKIMDAIKGLQTVEQINSALHKVYNSGMFQILANSIANRFVTSANIIDAKTWRDAARAGSKSKKIYEALQKTLNTNIGRTVDRQILKNANLIKTLPLTLSKELTKFISTKTYEGIRASEIAETLEGKIFQYTHARANTIARTESSKAMTALTEARSKDVGVNWYVWKSASDQRVRNAHKHMQGVLVRFDDPPSPEALVGEKDVGNYNAGNIYNCRCFPRPLISLENVKWPCKVYYNSTITSMSKLQFQKIM
ncbi:phage minor head protein [Clostridium sp. FP1]|uniref:phage head morphogenesis protein n=1 Tax=Clostridium sp. FP1 TaxID=2724076 RepID=UPI0013E95F09|nr:phage minor head protein [Clostridium sp. FP1]MBZ9633063.1 phage head morphogenesis protein [Clostridium sp. FP1]